MMLISNLPAFHKWIAGLTLLLLLGWLAFFLARPAHPDKSEAALFAAGSGDFHAALRLAAAAAQEQPGQARLWHQAGQYALQAGSPEQAIGYFEQALHLQGDLTTLQSLQQAYEQAGQLEAAAETWRALLTQPGVSPAALQWLFDYYLEQADYAAARSALARLLEHHPQDGQMHYQLGLLLAVSDPDSARQQLSAAALLDPALQDAARSLDNRLAAARRAGEPAVSLLEAGRGLASLGEWTLAVEAFEQAVQARPDYAEAWAFLGEAYQQAPAPGSPSDGLAELERALALDPNCLAAHTFLALYWQRQQEPDKALLSMHAAVRLAPNNPILHTELGKILARSGENVAALAAYQQAAALAPYEAAYLRLISEFSIEHDYEVRETGLPAARRALLLAPADPQNQVNMARVLIHLNDLFNAERFLLSAVQKHPTYAPAHLQLGIVYILQGETQRGLDAFEIARSLDPQANTGAHAARLIQTFSP